MIAPLPHRYRVALATGNDITHMATGMAPPLEGGAPPEFGGSDTWWSPESLLLASAGLCLVTTIQALARSQSLHIVRVDVTTNGLLERTPAGPTFTRIEHGVHLVVAPDDVDRANALVKRAKRHCIVSRSLTAPVHVEARVEAFDAGSAAREKEALHSAPPA